jgi:transcription elongation factor Elf1
MGILDRRLGILDLEFLVFLFLNQNLQCQIFSLLSPRLDTIIWADSGDKSCLSKETGMTEKRQMMEMCTCENCGNEAEMIVTCELVPVDDPEKKAAGVEKQERKSFTCESCGSEADMIIDL